VKEPYEHVRDNLAEVKRRIAHHCEIAGRDVSTVSLIVVTKKHPDEQIRKLAGMGVGNIGESYVDEFRKKFDRLAELNINWHYIGHLHRKRTPKVVGNAAYIHAVDSIRLARKIDLTAARKNVVQKILLQVNVSGEDTKHGFEVEEVLKDEFWSGLNEMGHVEVKGLMTMAPFTDDETDLRACFKGLKNIRDKLRRISGLGLPELSMGMTNDYGIAIEEGATMVRVGTAILGARR